MRKNQGEDPSSFICVELKSSASFTRFTPSDKTFERYLRQLLAYMIASSIENGLLVIRYENRPLIWTSRDRDKTDHFRRLATAPQVGIESWNIFLSMDDPLRADLQNEMLELRDRFAQALNTNDVSLLPRLILKDKYVMCPKCPFYSKCYIDSESMETIRWNLERRQFDPLAMIVESATTTEEP